MQMAWAVLVLPAKGIAFCWFNDEDNKYEKYLAS